MNRIEKRGRCYGSPTVILLVRFSPNGLDRAVLADPGKWESVRSKRSRIAAIPLYRKGRQRYRTFQTCILNI
jgi:hypothetical protein